MKPKLRGLPSKRAAFSSSPSTANEITNFPLITSIHTYGCVSNEKEQESLRGRGGWSATLTFQDNAFHEVVGSTGSYSTTINAMELLALLNGLSSFQKYSNFLAQEGKLLGVVPIFTSSEYTANVYNRWISVWKENGWRKTDGRPIANAKLVQRLSELQEELDSNTYAVEYRNYYDANLRFAAESQSRLETSVIITYPTVSHMLGKPIHYSQI